MAKGGIDEGRVSDEGWLKRAGYATLALSGVARLAAWREPSLGVILRFPRVRPRRKDGFQPLRRSEITPPALKTLLRLLPRWGYEIVSMDEAVARLSQPRGKRRFAVLTFDGWYRDVVSHALPLLIAHKVPVTVYIASGFPDGLASLWWLSLERAIARQPRIGLVIDGREQMFGCETDIAKQQLFDHLWRWMRTLPPVDLNTAIRDLCSRYSVDHEVISREARITWGDIARLSADPFVTFGSATVNAHALAHLAAPQARREIRTGRDVLDAALGLKTRHFAYPFGDGASISARDVALADEEGFASGVTTEPRLIYPEDAARPLALPRITWNSHMSPRSLRTMLAGFGMRKPQR